MILPPVLYETRPRIFNIEDEKGGRIGLPEV
jgi:hypothetical protein